MLIRYLSSLILALTSAIALAQPYEGYVKIVTPSSVISCGYTPFNLEMGKKKVTFSSPDITVDLTIKKKSRKKWLAVNKDGIVYEIRVVDYHGSTVICLYPELGSGEYGIFISQISLCK